MKRVSIRVRTDLPGRYIVRIWASAPKGSGVKAFSTAYGAGEFGVSWSSATRVARAANEAARIDQPVVLDQWF